MARSVSSPYGATAVIYTAIDTDDDPDCTQFEWESKIDDLIDALQQKFPSLRLSDKWLGNKDRAILENSFAYFGVSEYCGLVSVWVVPKEDYPLATAWAEKARASLRASVYQSFGIVLNKVATASNGEAFFQAAAR